jgi:hypothetical protein
LGGLQKPVASAVSSFGGSVHAGQERGKAYVKQKVAAMRQKSIYHSSGGISSYVRQKVSSLKRRGSIYK